MIPICILNLQKAKDAFFARSDAIGMPREQAKKILQEELQNLDPFEAIERASRRIVL